MFKLLKEKISGWFKKDESADAKKIAEKEISENKLKSSSGKKKEKKKIIPLTKKSDTNSGKPASRILDEVSTVVVARETKEEREQIHKKLAESAHPKEQDGEEKNSTEKGGFFSRLITNISTSELKKNEFDDFFSGFEMILLENNVALDVVDAIREHLAGDLIGKKFKKGEAEKKILQSLKDSIDAVLIEAPNVFEMIRKKTGVFVILFFGINGSGKTTSIAKFAHMLKKNKLSVVLAAGDTFRAASIEQLEEHAKRLDVPVVKQTYQSDPAAVGYDAIQYAKKKGIKVVLIDTAGRMYTKTNLLKEMEKIVKVTRPDLKFFVGESITGNDATEQAKTFNETAGIDGIILSKADVDERAGTILSVSYVTKKPIYFLGVGQNYDDLQVFKKKDVLKGLGLE